MTAVSGTVPNGGLDAVRELETALAERNDARGAADAALSGARAEAGRMLGDARAAGTAAGLRRRAAILADAEAETRAIRAAGETEAQELLERVSASREQLIAELTGLVVSAEG
jgi:hypothetical protein